MASPAIPGLTSEPRREKAHVTSPAGGKEYADGGFAMSSSYSSRPLAPEFLDVARHPYLVRARQTFKDLMRGESIADLARA
jgi:hypothetical protein